MRKTLIAGILVLAATGCGTAEQQKQAEQLKKGADEAAKGAQQIAAAAQAASKDAQSGMAAGVAQFAKGLQQMAQSGGPVIDFEHLKTLLPELPGYTRSTPRGEQITMPMKMSKAEARYEKEGSSIHIEITDSAFNQLILAPVSMMMAMGYEEKSDDGYTKAVTIAGSPAFEKWNKPGKDGEINVVVANRFIVTAKGNNVENIDVVRKAVQAVDLNKLAGMK